MVGAHQNRQYHPGALAHTRPGPADLAILEFYNQRSAEAALPPLTPFEVASFGIPQGLSPNEEEQAKHHLAAGSREPTKLLVPGDREGTPAHPHAHRYVNSGEDSCGSDEHSRPPSPECGNLKHSRSPEHSRPRTLSHAPASKHTQAELDPTGQSQSARKRRLSLSQSPRKLVPATNSTSPKTLRAFKSINSPEKGETLDFFWRILGSQMFFASHGSATLQVHPDHRYRIYDLHTCSELLHDLTLADTKCRLPNTYNNPLSTSMASKQLLIPLHMTVRYLRSLTFDFARPTSRAHTIIFNCAIVCANWLDCVECSEEFVGIKEYFLVNPEVTGMDEAVW